MVVQYRLHPPDLTIRQTHLYSVWVIGRIGKQFFNHANCLFTGPLVLFQDDRDLKARMYVFSFTMRHFKKGQDNLFVTLSLSQKSTRSISIRTPRPPQYYVVIHAPVKSQVKNSFSPLAR
jgi:hypothetical protein